MKIKPTPALKKLLPLNMDNDRPIQQHYRIRPDGSIVYTDGHYIAVTPPDPAYTGGEEIRRLDDLPSPGIRLPDDALIDAMKFGEKYYSVRYRQINTEITGEKHSMANDPLPTQQTLDKLSHLEDQALYYFEQMHADAERVIVDAVLLEKLVKWFSNQNPETRSRYVEITARRDGDAPQLQIQGKTLSKNADGGRVWANDGYDAWLMGVRR